MERVHFPKDEAAHRNIEEWWYYHGYLRADDNTEYGFMISFFKIDAQRSGLLNFFYPWIPKWLVPATGRTVHMHLSDLTNKKYYPCYTHHARLPFHVFEDPDDLHVHYGHSVLKRTGCFKYSIVFKHHNERLSLMFSSTKRPFLQGKSGLFDMGKKGFSYYYTLSNLNVRGTITVNGEEKKVRGKAWMDHQWGDWDFRHLAWTWLGIQLNNNTEIMLFKFKSKQLNKHVYYASICYPDSKKRILRAAQIKSVKFWTSPATKRKYGISWEVSLKDIKPIRLRVHARFPEQELFDSPTPPYWEGACTVEGTIGKQKVTGRAYVEQVNFDRRW